jgi:hypothetical protein
MLIPNAYHQDNKIQANRNVAYPSPEMDFQFRVTGPAFGREPIMAFVADRKLSSVDTSKFTRAAATPLSEADAKSLADELGTKDITIEQKPSAGQSDFAMHAVSYTTFAQLDRNIVAPAVSRYFFGFGVGKYRDSGIQPQEAASRDAHAVAKILIDQCGVPERNSVVLTDEQVTRERVRDIFCNILPTMTKPGDVIFIYWSGHGGRMSTLRNDRSAKPFTTYLVPYDGKRSDPENTMLAEGPFGQWVQRLNGRKVYFVIDTCYSGGMTAGAKGLDDTDLYDDDIAFPFCFTDFARAKSLGQDGLAILASSTGDQLSWEREDGKLSVMTHYFIEAIKNGSRTMTHKDIKQPVKDEVMKYNRRYRPNARQTVVEQDDLSPGLRLKP